MDNYLLILIVASLLFFAYFYKNDAILLYQSFTTCPSPSKKINIQPHKKTIYKKKNITESDNSNSDGDDRSYLSSNNDMSNDSNKSDISDNTKLSGATHSESIDFLESDNSIDLGSNDIKSIGSDYSGISGYSGLSNVSD